MVLAAGARLGSYEVLSPIGAGGMGEVYHARDTKLRRDVAIKALPEDFYQVGECVARFRREAELLAALNHANVATVHGLEEFDGRTFIVMELVEGETLADRIAQGPIPTREALPLFVQIAEGLSAAHEKGIVHRDLKPANIKISPDDGVKILDFGLAKAFAGDGEPSDSSHSPTLMKGTALGAVMRTAFYMSPERARGKSVDKRTDVWSFGCVLYEALTGRKAFDGETVTDVLGAIVNLEPDWKALPDGLHPSLHRVLRRSLKKKREERLHDIADARLDIQEALVEGSAQLDFVEFAPPEEDLRAAGGRRSRRSLDPPAPCATATCPRPSATDMAGGSPVSTARVRTISSRGNPSSAPRPR